MKLISRSSTNTYDHANLNAFGKIKSKGLKVVRSVAIAMIFVTGGIITGAAALASTKPTETRYGKLILVNDTPIPMIIYLIKPSADQPSRYAYVAGCTTRQLTNEYSTKWQFTTDLKTLNSLRETRFGQLEMRASSLQNGEGVKCTSLKALETLIKASAASRSNDSTLRATNVTNPISLFRNYIDDAARYADNSLHLAKNINNPSLLLSKMAPKNGRFTSPQYRYLWDIVKEYCPDVCDDATKNVILTKYLKYQVSNMRKNMYATVQNLAQEIPGDDIAAKNQAFVDDLISAAKHDTISDKEAKDLITAYLRDNCGVNNPDLTNALVFQWRRLRFGMQLLDESFIPMPTSQIPYQLVSNGVQQTQTLKAITSVAGCIISLAPVTSSRNSVISFSPRQL